LRGVAEQELADAAQLASLADETPEGRSIVVLAKEKYGIRGRDLAEIGASFIPFTAQSRMSGVEADNSWVRKGAVEAILGFLNAPVASPGPSGAVRVLQPAISTEQVREINAIADAIAKSGGTPLAVAKDDQLLGVIHLKDIVKGGIRERFAELRRMGIRTVRITGHLDSNPTKLIEIVEIGKQLLMTRGALTTFSIANDVAKYFAIIPAMFLAFYPQLGALNIMNLSTPQSAILSAIIFNALIIIALIPLALKGVAYRPIGAGPLLRRNLLIYGLGGVIVPFIGIKAIDLAVTALHLA
jgi:potassium-transporting ATPase ATP-binding subunit